MGCVGASLVLTVTIDLDLGVSDVRRFWEAELLSLIWTWEYQMVIIFGSQGFCPVIFEPLTWSASRRTLTLGLALALTSCMLVAQTR